jgi:hypothetical protein
VLPDSIRTSIPTDVISGLSANGTADGWAASVLDLDSQAWINEDIWAATADEVKTMVADFLRSILHYIGPVDWRRK